MEMSKDGRNLLDHICGQEKKDWFIEFCFVDIVILSGDMMINAKQNLRYDYSVRAKWKATGRLER